MRTTVTIDSDLASALKDLARKQRRPFKAVLNGVIRQGLAGPVASRTAFVVEPHAGGFLPAIDLRRLNQLADELEADDLVRESGR
jgi:hypothetical protein